MPQTQCVSVFASHRVTVGVSPGATVARVGAVAVSASVSVSESIMVCVSVLQCPSLRLFSPSRDSASPSPGFIWNPHKVFSWYIPGIYQVYTFLVDMPGIYLVYPKNMFSR